VSQESEEENLHPEPVKPMQRIGLMKGQFAVPDDFDTMMEEEMIRMFEGEEE